MAIHRICPYLLFIMTTLSCSTSIKDMLEPGVSLELARHRKQQISQVSYELHFHLPATPDSAVTGNVQIRFHQARAMYGVILDFQGPEDHIHGIAVNGAMEERQVINEHIIISSKHIVPGMNHIEVSFTSTGQALNRSEDFMYTLFVPDRASTAFPCFDQPDIKASFTLSLDIPGGWKAVSNGPLQTITPGEDNRQQWVFSPGGVISTYLFAFAAGRFNTVSDTVNGRSMTLFHRETDQEKLMSNTGSIFQQHAESLAWLEDYTGIPYPFPKFDMVLIPGFQYSGMEHPGAIWYRDNRLLLDQQAPISQQLSKASLIAHETAHMWFGDLVTMQWFDDVWLKEVFAGFMADKIVHPQFPDINHELQFILTHFPRALAIDRSKGTHPIKQELNNLKQAGTLYGAIIYNKAPIVFLELERQMGAEAFRTAVQEYLRAYSFGNADWDDLAAIFDQHTPADVMDWSRQWIYGTGMPGIYLENMDNDYLRAAALIESHERFLHSTEAPHNYFNELMHAVAAEENAQIMRYLINITQQVFWQFLSKNERMGFAPDLEALLWERMRFAEPNEKPVFFEAYTNMALTDVAMDVLSGLLLSTKSIDGLILTEEHRFGMLTTLHLRQVPDAETFTDLLLSQTSSPDRRRRITYLRPIMSCDTEQHKMFFQALKDPVNRRPEPWAIEGLRMLHHPLRSQHGKQYVRESLNMLEEIQQTGDIFFPLNWLDAVLSGYSDHETAVIVNEYLESQPDLSDNLRLKVLQAADLLFRAVEKQSVHPYHDED